MKTPTWVTVVGICMILFGGCGEISSIQKTYLPYMVEMQSKMLENMSNLPTPGNYDSLANDSTRVINDNFKNMTKGMQSMFEMSEDTKMWTVRFGYIGVFTNLIYILGGVFLLVRKRFSIKLAVGALLLSIIFGITQSIVLTTTSTSFLAKSAGFGNVFGIVVDIVLIIVIFSMDKSYFSFDQEKTS